MPESFISCNNTDRGSATTMSTSVVAMRTKIKTPTTCATKKHEGDRGVKKTNNNKYKRK